ncbi:hypothetical protein BLNAU_20529 [Blattamonas nauphoetae]|uniref:Uncharacterized protein n=1 Tax=Blattamonas nauphoetae TaxID=2049346 RepID=A0ABQ9X2Q4_9EUKA|nr:hypothetical protein BLNAU_20529 [Blattamonas nauphoetae]
MASDDKSRLLEREQGALRDNNKGSTRVADGDKLRREKGEASVAIICNGAAVGEGIVGLALTFTNVLDEDGGVRTSESDVGAVDKDTSAFLSGTIRENTRSDVQLNALSKIRCGLCTDGSPIRV